MKKWQLFTILPLALSTLVACSDSKASEDTLAPSMDSDGADISLDSAMADTQSSPDAAPDLQPTGDLALQLSEAEPNNGATETQFNAIGGIPARIRGTIGVDDADIFAIELQAGERLSVRVSADDALRPHLAIFGGEKSVDVPPVVSRHSKVAFAEHYALKGGRFFVAVRDERNVPKATGAGGSTGFGYTLEIARLTRAPVPMAIGDSKDMTMSPKGVIKVFSFDAKKDQRLRIELFARRLSPPSDVDTRLSLFHVDSRTWDGWTNDNPQSTQLDSLLNDKMPLSGTFHAIVENVSEVGSDSRVRISLSEAP